jgi:hypothetical protein
LDPTLTRHRGSLHIHPFTIRTLRASARYVTAHWPVAPRTADLQSVVCRSPTRSRPPRIGDTRPASAHRTARQNGGGARASTTRRDRNGSAGTRRRCRGSGGLSAASWPLPPPPLPWLSVAFSAVATGTPTRAAQNVRHADRQIWARPDVRDPTSPCPWGSNLRATLLRCCGSCSRNLRHRIRYFQRTARAGTGCFQSVLS